MPKQRGQPKLLIGQEGTTTTTRTDQTKRESDLFSVLYVVFLLREDRYMDVVLVLLLCNADAAR